MSCGCQVGKAGETVLISKSKLLEGDMLSLLRFAYCLDKQSLIDAFDEHGIVVENEKDLERLADLYNKGADVKGIVRDKDGNKVEFSVMDIYKSIEVEAAANKIAHCNAKLV